MEILDDIIKEEPVEVEDETKMIRTMTPAQIVERERLNQENTSTALRARALKGNAANNGEGEVEH